MIVTERQTERGLLVTVCDADVLGETFEGDGMTLDVTEEFYGGADATEATPEEVAESLGRASIANLVGTDCIDLAISEGYVDENVVLDVAGTRHAQVLRL